jgi:hypothetical protein
VPPQHVGPARRQHQARRTGQGCSARSPGCVLRPFPPSVDHATVAMFDGAIAALTGATRFDTSCPRSSSWVASKRCARGRARGRSSAARTLQAELTSYPSSVLCVPHATTPPAAGDGENEHPGGQRRVLSCSTLDRGCAPTAMAVDALKPVQARGPADGGSVAGAGGCAASRGAVADGEQIARIDSGALEAVVGAHAEIELLDDGPVHGTGRGDGVAECDMACPRFRARRRGAAAGCGRRR